VVGHEYDAGVLLGRTTECGRIDGLLEGARGGESGVLVLRGDPGIGKTALLRYARGRAEGFAVVETCGVESEAELPFCALAELMTPMLDGIGALPAPQAAAVRSALALGPPVPGDAFAVATGALHLIVAAAQRSPLLILVDDAQWLDAASAETLLFAARRFGGSHPVAMLAAVRDQEASAFDGAGLDELRVSGLDRAAGAECLTAASAGRLPSAVAARLLDATAGNPLALIELPALLDEAQLAGREPLPDPLPVAPSIRRAFEVRLSALPATTQQALLVAASSHSEALAPVLAALDELGLDPEALEPAEQATLVSVGNGRLTWRHPLLRAASYYRASSFERRTAHAALAAGSTGVERAWHLADAALGPDDDAAQALQEAAFESRSRRGHVAAAIAFERAARLSRDSDDAARRDLEAARDYHLAGRVEQARALLGSALQSTRIPALWSDIEHQLGVIEMWFGDAAVAQELLLGAAAHVEAEDPARAAAILMHAAVAREMGGDVDGTLAIVRRAHALARGGAETEPQLLRAMILAGEARVARPTLLELVRAGRRPGAPTASASFLAATVGQALIWLGEYGEARRFLERELLAARRSGSLAPMPYLLACLSELELRLGRMHAASANALESVQVAEDTGQLNVLSFCLATLARVEAATTREEPCREHARRALALADDLGAGSIRVYSYSALALLELGLGRPNEALSVLEELAALVAELGPRDPGVVEWEADLVEAQVLCGESAAAAESLRAFEQRVRDSGNTWAGAAAARVRGMLVADGFEDEFAVAHSGHASPFERARTKLRLGERLRRERRLTDARAPLRAAQQAFDRLGATGWSAQARDERAAAGGRPRRPRSQLPALLHELTEQELRIALLIAEGVTNREAAAALYLSPKTIGYHLGKVYDKLGVRSRTELAHLLAATEPSRPWLA
jgi:DNA-binding CsgD family transcriptional regulator